MTYLYKIILTLCCYMILQKRKLERCISLGELRSFSEGPLKGMILLSQGRLSVQNITPEQWEFILSREGEEEPPLKKSKS